MHHRNMFRPVLVILVFLSLGCLIHSEANAQRMRMSPEERVKQLKEQLKLTEAQVDTVTIILKKSDGERQKAMDSLDGDFGSMREVMTRLRENSNLEIEQILTDDQKKTFKEIQKEAHSRQRPGRRERRE